MIQDGSIFKSVIGRLPEDQQGLARSNAIGILEKIMTAYEKCYDADHIGEGGSGAATGTPNGDSAPTGLIYGRIQSGKTRAMITTASLALDNKFRVVVVMTSNINRLVDQTHDDFLSGIPGVTVIYKPDLKSNAIDLEAENVSRSLRYDPNFGVIIICSKGAQVLAQVIEFLKLIQGGSYPALILDDEGDQATLDTNVRARSRNGEPVESSKIHGLVHSEEAKSVREALPHNVFVSVTGTPQGIILQNLDSRSKPSFIELLEAGPEYTGGEIFFGQEEPSENAHIRLIDENERTALLEEDAAIPEGLKSAVARFVVSATAAGLELGWREYQMLCHPSVRQTHHEQVRRMVHRFVNELWDAIREPNKRESAELIRLLKAEFTDFVGHHQSKLTFDAILAEARTRLTSRRTFIINSATTNSQLNYCTGYNFLIGGNSVGRGLAFKQLLVTYYVRESRATNMDTMYQHARMFGYRRQILPYIKVFLPPQLYDLFHGIVESDEALRKFIEERGDEAPAALVRTRIGLRPTRSSVLDASNTKTLLPGTQIFPNYPIYEQPKAKQILSKVARKLDKVFPGYHTADTGKEGVTIDVEEAVKLLAMIPAPNSTNIWKDSQIADILTSISGQSDKKVWLRFRPARRSIVERNGLISTGALGGRLVEFTEATMPVVWLFEIEATDATWEDRRFIYPTIVLPEDMDPWVFNRS